MFDRKNLRRSGAPVGVLLELALELGGLAAEGVPLRCERRVAALLLQQLRLQLLGDLLRAGFTLQ